MTDLPNHASPEQLIQQLAAGSRRPADLSVAQRRQCVDHLTEQGLTAAEVAGFLRTSRRTVARDRAALRRRFALVPDPRLGDELLGEFDRLTQSSIARLTRLARDEQTPALVRLRAEREMTLIYRRFLESVARMKYTEDGTRRLRRRRDEQAGEPPLFQRDLQQIARWATAGQQEPSRAL